MLELRKICAIQLVYIIASVYAGWGDGGLEGGPIEAECMRLAGTPRPLPIELDEVPTGVTTNAQLARHHIIPANLLRRFFTQAARRNGENNVELGGILNVVGTLANDSLNLYTDNDELSQDIRLHLHELVELHENYINGLNRSLDVLRGNVDLVHSLTYWIPANIFIGPNSRSRTDDPSERFEENAVHIIGRRDYDRLDRIRRLMISYIATGHRNEFNEVIELLCEITRDRATPYPYDRNQWSTVKVGNKWFYFIKPYSSNTRRKRDAAVSLADKDPLCLKPIETFKMIKKIFKNKNLSTISKALERVQNSKNQYKFYEENKPSWKEYYNSIEWDWIYSKSISMIGKGSWYDPWGYKFKDESFAIGIVATDTKNESDNWVKLSYDFTTANNYKDFAGQVFFDKNGSPVAIVITSDYWSGLGSGWSFIYNDGKWEYESNENWHRTRFFGRTTSLDTEALKFQREYYSTAQTEDDIFSFK